MWAQHRNIFSCSLFTSFCEVRFRSLHLWIHKERRGGFRRRKLCATFKKLFTVQNQTNRYEKEQAASELNCEIMRQEAVETLMVFYGIMGGNCVIKVCSWSNFTNENFQKIKT